MTMNQRLAALLLLPGLCLHPVVAQEKPVFACAAENDLYRLASAEVDCVRFDTPLAAVRAARAGAAVLLLADQYPGLTTAVPPDVLEEADRKSLRLYVEYPRALPGVEIGPPKQDRLLRGVVTSDFFGPELRPMRIVTINGCSFVPAKAERSHLVLAKVAGVNTAVFGLKETPATPLLFEQENRLVATTKLSQFIRGRFMPEEAWRTIWRKIFRHLQPNAPVPTLQWTAPVRPTFGCQDPLPSDAEVRALRRLGDWVHRSRILRHPQWPESALEWGLKYNSVHERPGEDWAIGDGSLGLLEGYSSSINADGSQPMRYAVRNDCMAEVAMLMALNANVGNRTADHRVAANLLDYIFGKSGLAGGPRADPSNPAYGLISWSLDSPNVYYGDDNARALLGMLVVSALQNEARWSDGLARNLLANLRTSGRNGHRPNSLTQQLLEEHGWKYYWRQDKAENTPHMTAWLWTGFFWAYERTHFAPFLSRAETGCRVLVESYPGWDYVNSSGSLELARMILPLAWLVRVQDTPEHRQWLRRMAGELIALQDATGAIRETIREGKGAYKNCIPKSNAQYGTSESSLIQDDHDTVADLLYTCNFALIGLHEAAAATGERVYAEAEEKLAKFLCRIQIRSEAHPELDGAWYRAFNFGIWQYWASDADWEWGPWCIETGWTQPWIGAALALRQMKTSLWEVAVKAPISSKFEALRDEMIPAEEAAGRDGKAPR